VLPCESEKYTLPRGKRDRKSAKNEVSAEVALTGGNRLKKTLVAILAGVLLLTTAMPAFARKHHPKRHHHHHRTHVTQTR
jgi:hypothetical protein